jgi:hypothetical protein
VPAPEKAGKPQLVTTYNDQGNPQYELVEPGRMPVGKPAAKPSPAMQASEDERKAAGWVAQARNSLQNMRAVLSRNPSAADQGLLEAIAPESLANIFRSSDRQVFTQAASSFAEAALRAATGAGVNRDEAAQKIRELTPVFGDKPEVKLNKLQSMDVYLSSLESRAGRALSNSQSSVRQPVQVKSTAEYNALPSGAIFIDPNGVKRRKP